MGWLVLELVVSRDELIDSHQALTRMLSSYAHKYGAADGVVVPMDRIAVVLNDDAVKENYDYR